MKILEEILAPNDTFNRVLEEIKIYVLNETNHQGESSILIVIILILNQNWQDYMNQ